MQLTYSARRYAGSDVSESGNCYSRPPEPRGEVSFDGSNLVFQSTSAGPIGTTPGALFVWGINRGAGTGASPTSPPAYCSTRW
jgi:hypothetical protein